MKQKTSTRIIKGILAWLLALLVIIPFLIVIFNAFKTKTEAINMQLSLPTKLHWENFTKVWQDGNILRSYKNSFIITVSSVTITVLITSMCAFVLSRNRTRFNRALYIYFAMGLMFPVSMVSIVKVLRIFNMYNTLGGTILLFAALILPLSIFLFYGFVSGIPKELDEAAIVDGAGALRLFFTIILPLLKPATVTVVMINFLNVWNDFTVPLYTLPDPDKSVIVQQVYNFYGTYTASWNLVCVTILFAITPVLIIYIFGQRFIISGMVAGAVKG